MTYKLFERDYYYRPTPEDAGPEFDPVVWTREETKEVYSIQEALNAGIAFSTVWDYVKMKSREDGIEFTSGSNSEGFEHPDHYYTMRHELFISLDENSDELP